MSELTPMSDFEARFERRIQAYAGVPVRPIDADAVAHATVRANRRSALGWPVWPRAMRPAALALIALAAMAAALVGSALLLRDSTPPGALVFARDDGIYIADRDGGNPHRILQGTGYADPRWSSDGRLIAVARLTGSEEFHLSSELIVLTPEGSVTGRAAGPVTSFAWGPEGSAFEDRIAFTTIDVAGDAISKIKVVDSTGAVVVELAPTVYGSIYSTIAWVSGRTPDGDPGLIWSEAGTIWYSEVETATGGPIALAAELSDAAVRNVAVSPDRSTIAYTVAACGFACNGELWVVPVGGGPPTLVDDQIAANTWLSWSADGRSVVVYRGSAADQRRLFIVPIDGNPPRPLVEDLGFAFGSEGWAQARWSNDHDLLLTSGEYSKADVHYGPIQWPTHVWAISPASNALTQLGPAVYGADWRPHPSDDVPEPTTIPGFTATGSMLDARRDHAAITLADGWVLVVGGVGASGEELRSAEIYDPIRGTFARTGDMIEARAHRIHPFLLGDGRVLISGGSPMSAEIYDPASGSFSAADPILGSELNPPAALPDDRFLVFADPVERPGENVRVYDLATGTTKALDWVVDGLAVALPLPDGRVFVFFGTAEHDGAGTSAAIFDPADDSIVNLGDWTFDHAAPSAVLPGGRVLLAGGRSLTQTGETELYDPSSGTFETIASPRTPQGAAGPFRPPVRLQDRRVLLTLGDNGDPATWELFEPTTKSFSLVEGNPMPRSSATAVVLHSGLILITGGLLAEGSVGADAELYDPGRPQ